MVAGRGGVALGTVVRRASSRAHELENLFEANRRNGLPHLNCLRVAKLFDVAARTKLAPRGAHSCRRVTLARFGVSVGRRREQELAATVCTSAGGRVPVTDSRGSKPFVLRAGEHRARSGEMNVHLLQ